MTESLPPSPWVVTFASRLPGEGVILDLAAGGGRHTQFLARAGHRVLALDRDTSQLRARNRGDDLGDRVEIMEADLEDGSPWPLAGRRFAGIVVTNYLHRPLLPALIACLAPGGLLIYETFGIGNERFGKPSNPAFLLQPGELLDLAERNGLAVLGYFCGEVATPKPAIVQRVAALKPQ